MASNLISWASRQRAPFTMGLVASLIIFAVLAWATQNRAIEPLALANVGAHPWSVVTYPWAYSPLASPFGLIFLILLSMWLTQFGGTVERQMGTIRFAIFWIAFTLLPAVVAVALGVPLAGPWLPASAVIVAWCATNRQATIMLYGLLPLNGVWLAALTVVTIVFVYGAANPVAGFLMALPLGLAWLLAGREFKVSVSDGFGSKSPKMKVIRGGTAYDDKYFENVKDREIEREERERLRKLFEGK